MIANSEAPPPIKLRFSRALTLAALAVMVLVLIFSRNGSLTSVILQCVPLVIVVPGLLMQWYRSYSWLSLMILLYFIVAVTRAMAPSGNWADNVFVALTVTIFWSSAFCSRWIQQYNFQRNQQILQPLPLHPNSDQLSTEMNQNNLSKESL